MADKQFVFAVPGSLETRTGGYIYDKRIIGELRREGWQIDVCQLSERFPDPDAATLTATYAKLAAIAPGIPVVIDGLALGALGEIASQFGQANPVIALVHHPLAFETGLPPARAAELRATERAALATAHHVIATSATTASLLTLEYGVAASRITVAPPGTDPAPWSRGSDDGVVRLLSVGAIAPRKGYDVLVAALARLTHLPWRLEIVGDLTRDHDAAARLHAAVAEARLEDRVRLAGVLSDAELAEAYGRADIFVLASHYEGYGMVFTEALARGLPVVGTTAGAIPEAVPKGAGILVEPGDRDGLAGALGVLIVDAETRGNFAAAARKAAALLVRWPDAAELFAGAIVAARA